MYCILHGLISCDGLWKRIEEEVDQLRQQLKLSEEKISQLEEMISQLRKQLAAPKGADSGKLGAFGRL